MGSKKAKKKSGTQNASLPLRFRKVKEMNGLRVKINSEKLMVTYNPIWKYMWDNLWVDFLNSIGN